MTKQEAINAMLNGSKITHRYLSGYLFMDSGIVYGSDDDNPLDFENWIGDWEENWSIYRGESE